MADELNKTVPHEGDEAQPLEAAPMASDFPAADEQPSEGASTHADGSSTSSQADQPASSEDSHIPTEDEVTDIPPQAQEEDAERADEAVENASEQLDDTDAESALYWMSSSGDDSTSPMPTATAQLPEVVETPEYSYPTPDDEPQLRDVGATLAGWLRGRARVAASFIAAHRILLTLASLLCVLAVLAIVLFG
ncbi:MAG: hypothetical protein ACSW8D_10395, partial [Prevotella sp.]